MADGATRGCSGQSTIPRNMPLWRKAYFEQKATAARKALCPPPLRMKGGHTFQRGPCSFSTRKDKSKSPRQLQTLSWSYCQRGLRNKSLTGLSLSLVSRMFASPQFAAPGDRFFSIVLSLPQKCIAPLLRWYISPSSN